VVVERHRLDAQLARDPPHAQRVQAVAIDQLQRGADDLPAVERS
jgi:hypothetical protein